MCSHMTKTNAVQKIESYAHADAIWMKTSLNPKYIFNLASLQKSSMTTENEYPRHNHKDKTHMVDILLENQIWWEYYFHLPKIQKHDI